MFSFTTVSFSVYRSACAVGDVHLELVGHVQRQHVVAVVDGLGDLHDLVGPQVGHAVRLVEGHHEGGVVVLGELEGDGAVGPHVVVRGAKADHEDVAAVVGGVVVDRHRDGPALAELVVLGVLVLGVAGVVVAVVGRVIEGARRVAGALADHAVAAVLVVVLGAADEGSGQEQGQSGRADHGASLWGLRGKVQPLALGARRRRYIYSTPLKMEKIGNQVLLYTKFTQSMIFSYLSLVNGYFFSAPRFLWITLCWQFATMNIH